MENTKKEQQIQKCQKVLHLIPEMIPGLSEFAKHFGEADHNWDLSDTLITTSTYYEDYVKRFTDEGLIEHIQEVHNKCVELSCEWQNRTGKKRNMLFNEKSTHNVHD